MREMQCSEAKTHFLRLLDEVARGETIVITRHGEPVARLIPDVEGRRQRVREAFRRIAEIRQHTKPTTLEEILAWRHEGHRY